MSPDFKSTYRAADSATDTTLDFWYAYDSMNRYTVTRGQLRDTSNNNTGDAARGSGTIERGTLGLDVTWNMQSQRITETKTGSPIRYYYSYYADGTLAQFAQASGQNGSLSMTVPSGAYTESYTRDTLGRVTEEVTASGGTAQTATSTVYNMRSEVTAQDQVIFQYGAAVQSNATNYDYNLLAGSTYTGAYQGGVITHTGTNTSYTVPDYNIPPTSQHQATTYVWWQDAQQDRVTVQGSSIATSYTQYSYDLAGRVASAYISDSSPRTVTFVADTEGKVIRRSEPAHGGVAAKTDLYYRIGGVERGVVSTTSQLQANPGDPSTYYYGNFDETFEPGAQKNTVPTYVVMRDDTLQSIAQKLWGDSNLWYKLADANGLTGSETLGVGQVLQVPQGVQTSRNASDTFKPYDPNTALGNNLPTDFAPLPPRSNGCGIMGQILLMAIAVAVTIATHGAFAKMAAAAFHLTTGAAAVVGGAMSGVVSSLVSQTVGVAAGLQSKFSWGAVAMAGIGGAVGGALGPNGAFGKGGLFGAESAGGSLTKGVLGIAIKSDALRAGLTSMVGNVATQGVEVATRLQHKFDWAGVAAAGIGGAVGNLVGGQLHATSLGDYLSLANFGANLAAGAASAVAGAATRSVISGTDFGDNLMAVLPDAIGQTVGELFGSAIARSGTPRATGQPVNLLAGGPYDGPQVATDVTPFLDDTTVLSRTANTQADAEAFLRDDLPTWPGDDWEVGLASGSIARAERGQIRFLKGGPPGAGLGGSKTDLAFAPDLPPSQSEWEIEQWRQDAQANRGDTARHRQQIDAEANRLLKEYRAARTTASTGTQFSDDGLTDAQRAGIPASIEYFADAVGIGLAAFTNPVIDGFQTVMDGISYGLNQGNDALYNLNEWVSDKLDEHSLTRPLAVMNEAEASFSHTLLEDIFSLPSALAHPDKTFVEAPARAVDYLLNTNARPAYETISATTRQLANNSARQNAHIGGTILGHVAAVVLPEKILPVVRYGSSNPLPWVDMALRDRAAAETVPGITANKLAGDAVRDMIAAREAPALIEQSFTTIGGIRRVDVLKLSDELPFAIESKVGRTSLGSRERRELARDWWLLRQNRVSGVRWEFSPSGVNGGVGPSPALQQKLNKLGFETRINP